MVGLTPVQAKVLASLLERHFRKVMAADPPVAQILAIGLEVMIRAARDRGVQYQVSHGGVTWSDVEETQ